MKTFEQEVKEQIITNGENALLQTNAQNFMQESHVSKYSYNFSWLGRPIIQYPQDILAMQELIWSIQPDLIIETGIAHGGSLIFSASMLELNEACGGEKGAEVLGIDIDIRAHNKTAIEAHPMYKRITMLQGSSLDPEIVIKVKEKSEGKKRVLVCLDSNHTYEHVLSELELYAPLTSVGSYCVVFDTIVEDMSAEVSSNRPWGPGNSPKTASIEYLTKHPEFEVDKQMDNKLLISVAPDGYLKRVQ